MVAHTRRGRRLRSALLLEVVIAEPLARRATTRAALSRMAQLAEEIAEARDSRLDYLALEEFVGLAWQLGLHVPPPGPEVQEGLDARGLLLRPFEDPEPEPTDDDIQELTGGRE